MIFWRRRCMDLAWEEDRRSRCYDGVHNCIWVPGMGWDPVTWYIVGMHGRASDRAKRGETPCEEGVEN
jgi:hypothetical protein